MFIIIPLLAITGGIVTGRVIASLINRARRERQ